MVVLPTESVDVLIVAIPLATFEVPRTVGPAVKVTVPVTLVGSVSVKVTVAPELAGFADEVMVEDGLAFVSTRVMLFDAEL